MNEDDYVELQTLLAKLRVVAMKQMGHSDTPVKNREKALKIIRYIDFLKNNIIVDFNKKQKIDKLINEVAQTELKNKEKIVHKKKLKKNCFINKIFRR